MANVPDIRAASISISKTSLVIELQDGRTLTVPLSWFPDLVEADGCGLYRLALVLTQRRAA